MKQLILGLLAVLISAPINAQGTPISGKPIGQLYANATYPKTSDKAPETLNIGDFGAVGDGIANDTDAFVKACAKGKKVVAPHPAYKLVGEIPMVSGCSFEFTGNPVISIDLSGENGRGFWFGPGVENAAILGRAVINASATVSGSDGSRNGVFSFGGAFYLTSDPAPTRRNRIAGHFLVRSTGPANIKAVQMNGYVEDVIVDGITATGQMNYAFSAHWAGNGTAGTLPSKTWHPHRIAFINNRAIHDKSFGHLLRGFSVSAVGEAVIENTQAIDAQIVGYNVFVGDYGYTYAQNLDNDGAFNVTLRNVTAEASTTALSVDGISSRINDSPYWSGPQYNATVTIDGLLARMKAGTNAKSVAIAGLARLNASNLRIIEEDDGNTQQALLLTSIKDGRIQGDVAAKGGVLVRDCGNIDYQLNTRRIVETHNATSYALGISALSSSTTTAAPVNAGDRLVTITAAAIVTGPGGFLRYNDGVADHEMAITSMTYAGGRQTLSISPAPIAIPNGAKLTLIQTVKRMTVGPVTLSGARSLVRLSGTATSKPRNISFKGTRFIRSGLADIEATHVSGLSVIDTFHDHAGQATNTTNSSGILLGADAEGFLVRGARFGRHNTRIRYLIAINNAARNGSITDNVFESINMKADNSAAIYIHSASNVIITGNTTAAGIPTTYPQ